MGKNKGKSSGKQKQKSVFKVAGSKVAKGKAKPVTTNLKRVSKRKSKTRHNKSNGSREYLKQKIWCTEKIKIKQETYLQSTLH